MIDRSEIARLADRTAPDRCFVSLYLNDGDREWLRGHLSDDDHLVEPTELEAENLEPTLEMIGDWFDEEGFDTSAVAVFASWADDYLEVVPLEVPVDRRVVVDSSPFVLPLAEIADEYETWCIVLADHDAARVFEVSGLDIDEVDRAAGDIKNSVKVGGWSQQRYERRRLKQISEYCDEIADRLREWVDRGPCDRIVLAGDDQLVATLEDELPNSLADRVVGAERLRRDLSDREVFEALESVYDAAERREERELLETIQERRFRDGRAALGPEATLDALREGRVQVLAVDGDAELDGFRCRECQWLAAKAADECLVCGGDTFRVDLVNELVERAGQTDAETEVVDGHKQLDAWGGVAALLRY